MADATDQHVYHVRHVEGRTGFNEAVADATDQPRTGAHSRPLRRTASMRPWRMPRINAGRRYANGAHVSGFNEAVADATDQRGIEPKRNVGRSCFNEAVADATDQH